MKLALVGLLLSRIYIDIDEIFHLKKVKSICRFKNSYYIKCQSLKFAKSPIFRQPWHRCQSYSEQSPGLQHSEL